MLLRRLLRSPQPMGMCSILSRLTGKQTAKAEYLVSDTRMQFGWLRRWPAWRPAEDSHQVSLSDSRRMGRPDFVGHDQEW